MCACAACCGGAGSWWTLCWGTGAGAMVGTLHVLRILHRAASVSVLPLGGSRIFPSTQVCRRHRRYDRATATLSGGR